MIRIAAHCVLAQELFKRSLLNMDSKETKRETTKSRSRILILTTFALILIHKVTQSEKGSSKTARNVSKFIRTDQVAA